ncbi:hypothetical protein POPTR_010G204100v4 [Populus trichocarpa]|uniref:Uncharacterized protein n=1 Tax=Populus trichocarpa TaxID=3694 RepID=A0ACC0SEI4_POPTR|nr:hypothetical protein POPTR_010G204100v4 [Populus trichocarpa]
MAMLLNKSSKMGSPLLHEFKRQASFLKEKIKTARLALTDVTPTELTITNGDLWAPDTRTMGVISRAAFKVDDYWRITLLLLEHLLITHGPLRVAEEFQCDKDAIKEMVSFQFVHEKGFTWGSRVRKLSQRILKLLENGLFLQQKKKGQALVSFRGLVASPNDPLQPMKALKHQTSGHEDEEFMDSNEKLLFEETIQIHEDTSQPVLGNPVKISREEYTAEDHPFCDNLHHTTVSLLSASE